MNPMLTLHSHDGPMLLHPRYVMRVAGESVAALSGIETGETAQVLADGERLRQALQQKSGDLCAALERAIHGCDDRERSRAAINVKRALFNLRPLKAAQVQELQGLVDAETLAALRQFDTELCLLAGHDARVAEAYAHEIATTSQHIAALWHRPRPRRRRDPPAGTARCRIAARRPASRRRPGPAIPAPGRPSAAAG